MLERVLELYQNWSYTSNVRSQSDSVMVQLLWKHNTYSLTHTGFYCIPPPSPVQCQIILAHHWGQHRHHLSWYYPKHCPNNLLNPDQSIPRVKGCVFLHPFCFILLHTLWVWHPSVGDTAHAPWTQRFSFNARFFINTGLALLCTVLPGQLL